MDFSIKLTIAQWQTIAAALHELPFKTAQPILVLMEKQIAEQNAPVPAPPAAVSMPEALPAQAESPSPSEPPVVH